MKEVKAPKKPLIYYYGIVLLVILIFNAVVSPLLANARVKEVDYGTFMKMIEDKDIGSVEITDSEIVFTDKEEALSVIEKAILLFREQGKTGERFAQTIDRLGFENVEAQLLSDDILGRKEEILAANLHTVGGATC